MSAPLEGLRVVNLSSGIPGGYCARLLWDAGADVVKLEGSDGDPLRMPRVAGTGSGPQDRPLFQFLHGGHRSVVVPSGDRGLAVARKWIEQADVVLWSPNDFLPRHLRHEPSAVRALAPSATVLAFTDFGLEGPWAGRPASDLTLQAWAGGLGVRGDSTRPPVAAGGRLVDWSAGLIGAVSVLTARRIGPEPAATGDLLDLSLLECASFVTTMHPMTYRSIRSHPMRTLRTLNFPGIERTADGWVGFMVVTGQQWLDFCVLVEQGQWLEDESLISLEKRLLNRTTLAPAISAWMRAHTSQEIIDLATAFRIPVAPIGNGATTPQFDHIRDGGYFEPRPDGPGVQPCAPFRFHRGPVSRQRTPAPALGELDADAQFSGIATSAPARTRIEGLRVLDLTAFWAGPTVGWTLAMFGADVIHVESVQRPDGMRYRSARPFSAPDWWETGPGYHGTNVNKRGITLNLASDEGRALLLRLVEGADVLLENFTPRVMENLGLTYDVLRQVKSDLIMVRMPAFGLSGPWKSRPGYAQTVEQASGLAWLTGYPDDVPQVPNGPCDPIAGMHAAFATLLALEHRDRTGEGALVEASMLGAALSISADQYVEYSSQNLLLTRSGNDDEFHYPSGIYQAANAAVDGPQERWIALTVLNATEWRSLVKVLGFPTWAGSPDFDDVEHRRRHRDDIDAFITEWCRNRESRTVVDTLWAAGVPVAEVGIPEDQDALPQLQARRFFETLRHPVVGETMLAGFPVRFSSRDGQPWHRFPSPLLGQHNDEVLGSLPGMTPEALRSLEKKLVVGTQPVQ